MEYKVGDILERIKQMDYSSFSLFVIPIGSKAKIVDILFNTYLIEYQDDIYNKIMGKMQSKERLRYTKEQLDIYFKKVDELVPAESIELYATL